MLNSKRERQKAPLNRTENYLNYLSLFEDLAYLGELVYEKAMVSFFLSAGV
jgi:hypothetical protein